MQLRLERQIGNKVVPTKSPKNQNIDMLVLTVVLYAKMYIFFHCFNISAVHFFVLLLIVNDCKLPLCWSNSLIFLVDIRNICPEILLWSTKYVGTVIYVCILDSYCTF